MQVSEEEDFPFSQVQLSSIIQPLVHPSPSTVFPSSHSSVPARSPSPHTVMQEFLVGFGMNPAGHNLHVSGLEGDPPVHM